MSLHYAMKDVMLKVIVNLRVAADAVHTDGTVAFYSHDTRQINSMSESCLQNVEHLRDKCNEILALAAQAVHRPNEAA